MASPKSGKEGSIVAPAAPDAAKDAMTADPGAAAKFKADPKKPETGKFTTQGIAPFKPMTPAEAQAKDKKLTWIEIELQDAAGHPVAGAEYWMKMPDDSILTGSLDDKGLARVEGVEEGNIDVSFPEYSPKSWEKK
jgi:type VI secretion system secreted protein VgrG